MPTEPQPTRKSSSASADNVAVTAKFSEIEKLLEPLKPDEKEYAFLRMNLILSKIDRQLEMQREQVQLYETHDTNDLMSIINRMSETVGQFKEWFRLTFESMAPWTFRRYLELVVTARNYNVSASVMRVLEEMMTLLPAEMTLQIRHCHGLMMPSRAVDEFSVQISQARAPIIKVNCTSDEASYNVLQFRLRPNRSFTLQIISDESLLFNVVDPVGLLGHAGALYCSNTMELAVQVRLWPESQIEALFRQAVVKAQALKTSKE